MRSKVPLNAHQNCILSDSRPLLQPNRHCQGRQELYWHICSPVSAVSGKYMNKIDLTACTHCHDCGHLPHDTHHCPSKPTTLTVESLCTAPTEAAKHLNLVIDERSQQQQQKSVPVYDSVSKHGTLRTNQVQSKDM